MRRSLTHPEAASLAGLGGVATLLSLASPGMSPLAWCALVPLVVAAVRRPQGSALWPVATSFALPLLTPIAAGIGALSIPVAAGFLAVGLVALVGMLLTLDRALPVGELPSRPLTALVGWPAAVSVTVWLLDLLPPHLPLHIGLSQWRSPSVVHLASWGGLPLVDAVIIGVNLSVALLLVGEPGARARRWGWAWPAAAAGLLLLSRHTLSAPGGAETLAVAVLQPAAHPEDFHEGWLDPSRLDRLKATYDDDLGVALADCPDLVVWPENGDGTPLLRSPLRLAEIRRALGVCPDTWVLLSAVDWDGHRRWNSVASLSPDGRMAGRYDKHRLTVTERSSFEAGRGPGLVPGPRGLRLGALICFESTFSDLALLRAREGADLLVVSASDTPFRGGLLRTLHAANAPFRAAETGLPLVRAGVTGPSLWIDAFGRVLYESTADAREVAWMRLPLARSLAWYGRGGGLAWTLVATSSAAAVVWSRRRRPVRLAGGVGPQHHRMSPRVLASLAPSLTVGVGLAVLQWWPARPPGATPGEYLRWLRTEVLGPRQAPTGEARAAWARGLAAPTPFAEAVALAASTYGTVGLTAAEVSRWPTGPDPDGGYPPLALQGLQGAAYVGVRADALVDWPLPSIVELRVDGVERPVALLGFDEQRQAAVYDPLHPSGFVFVTPDGLEALFTGRGLQLSPLEPGQGVAAR